MHKRSIELAEMTSILDEDALRLNTVVNGTENMDLLLSRKLGNYLEVSSDYFMKLQEPYYLKKLYIKHPQKKPNLDILRRVLFWDTDIDSINWEDYKGSVIMRVFQRGNFSEKKEIVRFYGSRNVREFLNKT